MGKTRTEINTDHRLDGSWRCSWARSCAAHLTPTPGKCSPCVVISRGWFRDPVTSQIQCPSLLQPRTRLCRAVPPFNVLRCRGPQAFQHRALTRCLVSASLLFMCVGGQLAAVGSPPHVGPERARMCGGRPSPASFCRAPPSSEDLFLCRANPRAGVPGTRDHPACDLGTEL